MMFLKKVKDGGHYSKVTAYVLIEIKCLFSIMLLRFDEGSREAFHSHAFNCISWVLSGGLWERILHGGQKRYFPSWRPVITKRSTFHQVWGLFKTTWVLTFRGPWKGTWMEYIEGEDRFVTLTHGRKEI